jgi:hypothetical protein
MVPGTAEVGDIICRFNLAATTYVLRRTLVTYTELDTTILDFVTDSKLKVIRESRIWEGVTTRLFASLDTSKVEHYNFISECFAELPSNWKGFWERGERVTWGDFVSKIFTPH